MKAGAFNAHAAVLSEQEPEIAVVRALQYFTVLMIA